MSFSNAPAEALLGRVAGALAVDEAFVEKDWYVVAAIRSILNLANDDVIPVFSGGTCLLKAHSLIRRFSEDIDFKLILSDDFRQRSGNAQRAALRAFRDTVSEIWTSAGFTITACRPQDSYRFLDYEMSYPSVLKGHDALRPHILAQFSAKSPRLPVLGRGFGSFVGQFERTEAEVMEISCVDPIETAADKLSALSWRLPLRDRSHEDDDPAIVRHLHDLAALEPLAQASAEFPNLLRAVLVDDTSRGRGALAALSPEERIQAMLATLADDPLYLGEYERFVGGMAFAGGAEIPTFAEGVAAVERLSARLA
jgi:hypothetical protein